MRAVATAVVENVSVVASAILKRISKDRHSLKGSVGVDALCDAANRTVIPSEPCWVDGDGAEKVADDFSQQVTLKPFCLPYSSRAVCH